MTVATNRLANGTIELTITIPWSDIQTTYNQVIDDFVKEAELPGFRKGKAPKKVVEEKLDKNKIYEEVMKRIIPKAYADAVKQESVAPIIPPKVEVIAAQEGKDWQFKASTCKEPEVKLGDYKDALNKAKSAKLPKIWVPGKEEKKGEPAEITLDEVINALLGNTQINIPSLLIEDEVNRMLSRLIDQTQKLGLTVEQYLLSQGKTSEGLRAEYKDQASRNLALEFILEKVANQEKIEVGDEEIEKVIKEAKEPKEQEALRAQKYYLATILRRQKTLDYLKSLAG